MTNPDFDGGEQIFEDKEIAESSKEKKRKYKKKY